MLVCLIALISYVAMDYARCSIEHEEVVSKKEKKNRAKIILVGGISLNYHFISALFEYSERARSLTHERHPQSSL